VGDFVKKWHFSLSVANSNPKHKILNFGPHSLYVLLHENPCAYVKMGDMLWKKSPYWSI
jgi:hypothetical protein